ncbi:hypothetical protein AB0F17_23100 [Nonomuraea sp. NPDC026600]|uniref:hypothetical protein n=1 Tax=Nonomuraea sp. NPDC026600 TaxID=3155363 RepID=UPI00340C6DDF
MVITCEEDATANLVITALNKRGVTVARVDPADIGPDLVFSAQIGAGKNRWAASANYSTRTAATSAPAPTPPSLLRILHARKPLVTQRRWRRISFEIVCVRRYCPGLWRAGAEEIPK